MRFLVIRADRGEGYTLGPEMDANFLPSFSEGPVAEELRRV
jgi:hypothetical protein